MANEPDIPQNLGANLLSLRKERGLSQAALAEIANVPRSTLTYMESGLGNPSLSNLLKIAGALQVKLEELLATPRADCQLFRQSDIPMQLKGKGAVKVFKLLPDPIPGMEIDRMEIKAGGLLGGVPHTKGTKEYFTCIEGSIEIRVSGESYQLNPGDVLAFPGDSSHSYRNLGRKITVGISVIALAMHI